MYVHSSLLSTSLDEVFAWHARPGALQRLLPPWQPLSVRQEAASLRDGEAIIAMPAGRRWVATHDPEEYDAPRRFTDRLTSRPFVVPMAWRHRHELTEEGGGTRLTDRVQTSLPDRLLRAMFDYRHRQLSADLAAHAWAAALHPQPLRVAMTGASGTIGTALAAFLGTGGHQVIRLVRREPHTADERRWDPDAPAPGLLDGVDAVVHLAGASIAGRFDARHRAAIRDSRLGPTRHLAQAARRADVPVFVSASAIGYYGADRGDDLLTETATRGDGFLADVVEAWEEATREAAPRVVQVRTGIVQTPAGGALRLQLPLYRAGLGGPLGSGEQWTSWLGLDDLLDVYLRALVDGRLSGPVNAAAPRPVRQREYARALGRALHRPALLPVPALGPRLLLGAEGAHEVALASQRVVPEVLTSLGHRFRHPDAEAALRHLLGTA